MSESTVRGLVVRSIRPGDVEAVIQVDRRVGGSRPQASWRGLLETYADPLSDYVERLNSTLCQLAVLDGEVVGFILGDIQSWQFGIERCGRVLAIGVDPAHSREQIGTVLLQALSDVFRARKLGTAQCLVEPGTPLYNFFSSNGFQESSFEVLELDLDARA